MAPRWVLGAFLCPTGDYRRLSCCHSAARVGQGSLVWVPTEAGKPRDPEGGDPASILALALIP